MYLEYNFGKTFSLLLDSLTHFMMWIIIISVLVLGIIIFINRSNTKIKYFLYIINILIIAFIIYYYSNHLISNMTFINMTHNLYFYFLNTILYLVVFSIKKKKKINKYLIIQYLLLLIFVIYALFMTSYVYNVHLIVIGNIYPMIVYGNYLYLIFYIYCINKCLLQFRLEK